MSEPHQVLGLEPGATWSEVCLARRRLAKALHPDLHAGVARREAERRMAAVNRAFDELRAARDRAELAGRTGAGGPTVGEAMPTTVTASPSPASFSVGALPVDAFEAVLMAAIELGDVIHVEEPYLLGVLVDHPGPCQCILELAPEAGGTLVSIDVGPRAYGKCPAGDAVRDAFVDEVRRQATQPI